MTRQPLAVPSQKDNTMLKKTYTKNKSKCKVTFKFEPTDNNEQIDTIQVVGSFNGWGKQKKHFLKKRKDGTYSLSVNLSAESTYEYKYLVNDSQWYTDNNAENYVWNIYGSQNALVEV